MQFKEELYNEIIDYMPIAIIVTDLNGEVVLINKHFTKIFGYVLNEIPIVKKWAILAYPDDDYRNKVMLEWAEDVKKAANSIDVAPKVFEIACKDGSKLQVEISFKIVNDKVITRLFDLTEYLKNELELKKVEQQLLHTIEQKDLFLREIHHRVKNNLQIVISLIKMQAYAARNTEGQKYIQATALRVETMGLLHEKLFEADDISKIDMNIFLRSIIAQVEKYQDTKQKHITFDVTIKDIYFNMETAIPCSLLINEIITNSVMHAFPEASSGRIVISIEQKEDEYLLEVYDDGIGIPADVNREIGASMGLRLIEMLAKQLHASMQVEKQNGTKYDFAFMGMLSKD